MYEDLLDSFDESGLDPRNTVVRCETIHEATIFIQYLVAKGVRQQSYTERLLSRWDEFGSSTCYHLSQVSWCSQSWYEESNPKICVVSFSDIYKPARPIDEALPSISFDELMRGV